MACGTPVITGNTSSMPEVGGPGILAIDPCRPEEIARAVLRLENEDTLYRRRGNTDCCAPGNSRGKRRPTS